MTDYIKKSITNTIVNGFVLDNGVPVAHKMVLSGPWTKERAEAKARKAGMLVSGIEQVKQYYKLDRMTALEKASTERINKDDIQIGKTYTIVHYFKLDNETDNDSLPTVVKDSVTLFSPMTKERAFGAARRALDYDILPYASEQIRDKWFIARDVFFELATPIDDNANNDDVDSDDIDSDENIDA